MGLTMLQCQTSEQLILATMRLLRDDDAAGPQWHVGLRAAGLPESAIEAFHNMFFLIKAGLRRELRICGLRCVCIGGDEFAVLRAIAFLQREKHASARALLEDWLPRSAARLIQPYVQTVAEALDEKDLRLPLRHGEFGAMHHVALVQANAGLSLVH